MVLRYADHADGLVDVFLPPSLGRPVDPAPLLVLLHGGFWRQEFDRRHLRPLAAGLVCEGFVVATPEYRRVGGLGGWPATGDDVEAVVVATAKLIDGAAGGWISPSHPGVLVGHSAGGHLAMWAGLRAGPGVVRRIVALAPVTDLEYAAHTGLGDDAAQALLGGGPDEMPDAYADADPLRLGFGDVTVTVVHGTDDEQVPVEMSRRVAVKYPALGYLELEGVDHFDLIDPLSLVFQESVLPALRS
jgi:acetyl esterase/lipase